MNKDCKSLKFALDEYSSRTIEDLLYDQDHIVVKKSDKFYYSDKGSHSPTEVTLYESLRKTPLTTLLQQFSSLEGAYVLKLVTYYYNLPTLLTTVSGTSSSSTGTPYWIGTPAFEHRVFNTGTPVVPPSITTSTTGYANSL